MRNTKILIAAVVAVIVLAVGGTAIYINVIKDEVPEKLSLDSDSSGTSEGTSSSTTVASDEGTTDTTDTTDGSEDAGSGAVDGTWTATSDSIVGYRVKEVLFGQDTEGVGRTSDVTGSMSISGSTVETARFEVDMTTVKSDSTQRDGQFRGRIMNTEEFPTASFELTSALDFGEVPADGVEISGTATGDLTLKGETKEVDLDLTAVLDGDTISVLTTYEVVFADWGIDDPSFGPAQVEDRGLLEIKLVFERG